MYILVNHDIDNACSFVKVHKRMYYEFKGNLICYRCSGNFIHNIWLHNVKLHV